jgi:pimeloyl-ACP methyl ester carboxylesterase
MRREGSGEPLVLLHGILCDVGVWGRVMPLLAPDFDTIALNALGHLGGPGAGDPPIGMDDLVDATERQLDELGIERPHLAGNSLGGWMAIELARRGRASSVCGISPAGAWEAGWEENDRAADLLRIAIRESKRGRRVLPVLALSARFRRYAAQNAAVHGDRISRREMIEMNAATNGCTIGLGLLDSLRGEELAPLDPLPCPVTLAWAEKDVLFPVDVHGTRARELMPEAEFVVLEDTGHIPMLDDPGLVAEAIRASARRSSAGASLSSPGS